MGVHVEIKNVTKTFGRVTALDRIDLATKPGEFLVLLGPSGCGKTTLLRCIAGLEKPDEGEMTIGDQVVFSSQQGLRVPPGKRQLGMVFQSYALWPHMTVYENIGFGLSLQKISRQEVRQRVDQVLQDLFMEGLGERYPSELSGGQQQRVALARLLVSSPPVFLMDEPLSNLDARLRIDMRSELKRLHYDSGATTVYVTHDQTEAMTMADRIVVMKDGRIEQLATAEEVYRQPATLFVANFVGMPRINLLPARSVLQNDRLWLEIEDFRLPGPWSPSQENVIAAIRPEDVRISLEPEPDAVEFQVYVVQPNGPEFFVQVKRRDTSLMIRETRQLHLKMDQLIWITVNSSAINLYDKTSGSLLFPKENER